METKIKIYSINYLIISFKIYIINYMLTFNLYSANFELLNTITNP